MRRQQPQVALFPFLSVLLCTLGALIFLLIVLDSKLRLVPKELAPDERTLVRSSDRTEDAPELPTIQDAPEVATVLHELGGWLQALTGCLKSAEHLASSVREEMHVREHELRSNASDLDAIAAQLHSRIVEQRAAIEEYRRRAAALLRQLGQAEQVQRALEAFEQEIRTRSAAAPPVYVVIPYRGKLGAPRVPVVLECRDHQVRFLPQGPRYDLKELLEGRTWLAHLESRMRSTPGNAYVLLFVRPSGIAAYYAVLRILQELPIEIGYDLIDEDTELELATVPNDLASTQDKAPASPPAMRPGTSGDAQSAGASVAAEGPWHNPGPRPALVAGGQRSTSTSRGSSRSFANLPDDGRLIVVCAAQWIEVRVPGGPAKRIPIAAGNVGDKELGAAIAELTSLRQTRASRLRIHYAIQADALRTYYAISAALAHLHAEESYEIVQEDAHASP